jgi:serine/threonine-protein kinase
MTQSPRESHAPVGPGDVLAGKYRVERVLGAGGMGVVVQAVHLELEQRVAMKFLLPGALEGPEAVTRFMREARAAVKIKSEHVARVIDVGRLETGAPFIVMEFLDGSDIAAVLRRGTLAVEEAVDYVLQACEAMAEAHAAGIVHRDLKPSNLFLCRRSDGMPIVKVLDFGISKMNGPELGDAALTQTAQLMGSPFYMSPEQMRSSRAVDHRTDIWSLGVILFELLAGAPPFRGETLTQLISAVLSEQTPSLRALRHDVTPELEHTLYGALEKDVDRRFRHIGEFVQALAPFAPPRSRDVIERVLRLSGLEGAAKNQAGRPHPRSSAPPALLGATATVTHQGWAGTRSDGRARRSTRVVLAGAIVVVVGALAALFVHRRTEPQTIAQVPPTVPAAPPASAERAPVIEPVAAPVPVPAEGIASAAPPSSSVLASASSSAPSARPPQSLVTRAPQPVFKPRSPLTIDLK